LQLLQAVDDATNDRKPQKRNRAIYLKKQIEKACQAYKAPRLKKCVRRYQLAYIIDQRALEKGEE